MGLFSYELVAVFWDEEFGREVERRKSGRG